MSIGGDWAVYTVVDPGDDAYSIRLTRRTGAFIDDFDWVTVPYSGPLLSGVAPDTAMIGTQVVISGTGFDQGALRVFFGGVEGTIDTSDAMSITATVPDGALPGLVWVLIDNQSPFGLVGFQLNQSWLFGLRSVGRRISSASRLAFWASSNHATSKSSKLFILSAVCFCIPSKINSAPALDVMRSRCMSNRCPSP